MATVAYALNETLKTLLEQHSNGDTVNISKEELEKLLTPPTRSMTNKPKRPQSGYFLYLNSNRENITKILNSERTEMGQGLLEGKARVTEVTKRAGVMWAGLDEETKKPYLDQAIELKEKYDIDIYNWKTGSNNSVVPESTETPKRGRGRPKGSKNKPKDGCAPKKSTSPKKPSTHEPLVDEEEVVRVEKFAYNDVVYLLDKSNGDLYDQETQDIVGKKTEDSVELFE